MFKNVLMYLMEHLIGAEKKHINVCLNFTSFLFECLVMISDKQDVCF